MKKHSITILYNSPVILTFALLSLLALGLGKLTDGWTTQNLFCVYRSPLTDWLTYPRFFLHVLGHPDFAAYCSNIVMLLVVGPTAEERFGGKRILLAIALTALVTGLVLWFFFPNSALMGASGVVFMLIVLASFAGMRTGTIPLTLILVLILYLGSEIFQAVTGTAGLAQLTHIAGGVPNLEVRVPQRDEAGFAWLVCFFELACAISGYMSGVNPFDQPGVEAYKKNMFSLLGKPEAN